MGLKMGEIPRVHAIFCGLLKEVNSLTSEPKRAFLARTLQLAPLYAKLCCAVATSSFVIG